MNHVQAGLLLLQTELHTSTGAESQQPSSSRSTVTPSDLWLVFGHVKFEGVGLQYTRRGDWALREVDLEVQPGQSVGVVGRTGQS